jgi:hypothetical protein
MRRPSGTATIMETMSPRSLRHIHYVTDVAGQNTEAVAKSHCCLHGEGCSTGYSPETIAKIFLLGQVE